MIWIQNSIINMTQKDNILNFLELIPQGKVISINQLADIFCTSIEDIKQSIWGHKSVVLNKKDNDIWVPVITNYYVSLITKDSNAIPYFEAISHKIRLLNPTCVIKTPNQYHITLADLSNIPITSTLVENIFSETEWLHSFSFHCTLHKPYIDSKKNKVIFWIRIDSNPFLITLHECIKIHVPRRTDKQFIPHITLGKILWTTLYNKKIEDSAIDIQCVFNELCIVANIDSYKNIVLFSKEIV